MAAPGRAPIILGKGHTAVRAMKRPRLSDGQPWQQYELFPAPPWATRSLFEHVLPLALGAALGRAAVISEPAAGLGHMSDVIAEYSDSVHASDIYPYPGIFAGPRPQIEIADFLDPAWHGPDVDWVITNPPFGTSHLFLDRALERARRGVALLQRMQWLEGQRRYRGMYEPRPPTLLAPFVERVAMCEGGWDPEAATATWYGWFLWVRDDGGSWRAPLSRAGTLAAFLIPPGRKEELTFASDILLAHRCVPGFAPPSLRKMRSGRRKAEPALGASASFASPALAPDLIDLQDECALIE